MWLGQARALLAPCLPKDKKTHLYIIGYITGRQVFLVLRTKYKIPAQCIWQNY